MINVYIDPSSYLFLDNKLFVESPSYYFPEGVRGAIYLKRYCLKRNINLNTIDFWDKENKTENDIYVSFEHKNLLRKIYWHFKNKNYPIFLNLSHFKKRILFNNESPTVLPEVYKNIDNLFTIYDEIYFSHKINHPVIRYLQPPFQPYDNILLSYWNNFDRKFLVMINANKMTDLYRRFIIFTNKKRLPFQKNLLGERIKIIEFFSRTNDIDLYGLDWDKRLPFPYWFHKKAIKKVYKGPLKSKHQKLSEYTFAIATENNITPGFISESLFDCFFVGTIPIYLGAPDVQEYIPKECFIDMRNFKNYEELRKFLKSLTESEIKKYKENGRLFLESEKYKPFTKEYFAKIFVGVCTS